jgi:HK97 gp10 family phage protein
MPLDARAAIASLRVIESELLSNVHQVLDQSTAYAAQLAKSTTRFRNRTGNLRASIARGSRKPFTQFVRAGDRKAYYAPFVEFGTSRMSPRAYMKEARDQAEKVMLRLMLAGASRALT